MNKVRTYSRKGRCSGCNVATGSRHNKTCQYAYRAMPNSKQVQKSKYSKLKAILNIIRGK